MKRFGDSSIVRTVSDSTRKRREAAPPSSANDTPFSAEAPRAWRGDTAWAAVEDEDGVRYIHWLELVRDSAR